jgi:hypothetical protein
MRHTLAALALLLAVRQDPPARLELRTGDQWTAWRAFVPGAPAGRDPLLDRVIAWRDSVPGLRLGAFEVRTEGRNFSENSVAILEIDPARFRFALDAAPAFARRTADDWMRDTSLVAAMNTGLFRVNGTPQGLVLLDGARRSALAGWLDVVVAIEGGVPRVTDITEARSLPPGASAFQTLPWLVRDGRVVLGVTSGVRLSTTHRDRRLTLCLGGDDLVRILLSNFEVFGQNAGSIPIGLTIPEQAIIASAAGCRDAVALDGGISAQVVARIGPELRRMPGWRRVPLMLLVRRR